MNKTNAIKDFWENKHKLKDVAALSGCLYEETVDFLRLNAYIVPRVKVLEVGVGLGYVTKGLHVNDTIVSALDLSEISLSRVKDYCERVYNTDSIEELPSDYFDVIICNNVVQHVVTSVLKDELRELVRSLKTGGHFALEFVSNDNGTDPSIEQIKNGGICRTPEFLEQLINDVGGNCELVFDKKVDLGIVQGHHVFHVHKEVLNDKDI